MKWFITLVVTMLPAPLVVTAEDLSALMPRPEDYTSMWWVDGFPGVVPRAPWHRCIQTGHYAFVLDTQTLQIPHFGPVPAATRYTTSNRVDASIVRKLPPADLAIRLQVDGKVYRCTAGGTWSRFTGPRLIESGRCFQRSDVTNLSFTADDGTKLNVEARFETAAWPDRLALILAARPGRLPIPAGEACFGRLGGGFGLDGTNHFLFQQQGQASMTKLSPRWTDAGMEIELQTGTRALRQSWELPKGQSWTADQWQNVALAFDPITVVGEQRISPVKVQAFEIPGGAARPVVFDSTLLWHRVNLDGIEPIAVSGAGENRNDSVERVKLLLSNPTDREQPARLMFEKTAGGIRQRIGTPITGISAILRDSDGNPTGIPVQLSKNWHNNPAGGVYADQWFHGISQVRLPPATTTGLELTIAYGHWGGVPAASHAQLSLIGWGSNQLWNQSALGSWGESICFEPDQVQAHCTITDVRPLMVRSMGSGEPWGWTGNVGGGDLFRLFDPLGRRVPHTSLRTIYHRQGPCLTEATYAGRIGAGVDHRITVSLARSDDVVRATYRIRLDVDQPTDFSRLVIFQIGADTYSSTRERKFAVGNETGLLREWQTQWGGDVYRSEPLECSGRIPWASLHEAVPRENQEAGALANRGVVIRSWKARLGGEDASPWMSERGLNLRSVTSSTLDVLPPPGVNRLQKGDFIEATIEQIVMPQFSKDYYGPNEALRAALIQDENTWRMIHREAIGNDRKGELIIGTLQRLYPDVCVETKADVASIRLSGGHGYVAMTFTGLSSSRGYRLLIDGRRVNQSVHGNDFWQTDYDPMTGTWSRTYNVSCTDFQTRTVRFEPER